MAQHFLPYSGWAINRLDTVGLLFVIVPRHSNEDEGACFWRVAETGALGRAIFFDWFVLALFMASENDTEDDTGYDE